MLAVLHVIVGIINTLGHQPSSNAFVQVPHEEPLVPVSAVDAARTLLRNHSSISRLPQSARSGKGSSGPRSCCRGAPHRISGFWGYPLPNFCSPCSRLGALPACFGACICCAGSPMPSSVVASLCPQAAAATQGHTSLHRHPFVGTNTSS